MRLFLLFDPEAAPFEGRQRVRVGERSGRFPLTSDNQQSDRYPPGGEPGSNGGDFKRVFNRFASTELMSNIAMIYRTPTYAGVDSDQSQEFVEFLGNFQRI